MKSQCVASAGGLCSHCVLWLTVANNAFALAIASFVCSCLGLFGCLCLLFDRFGEIGSLLGSQEYVLQTRAVFSVAKDAAVADGFVIICTPYHLGALVVYFIFDRLKSSH